MQRSVAVLRRAAIPSELQVIDDAGLADAQLERRGDRLRLTSARGFVELERQP